MTDKTITLRSDLADRLHTLAQVQGRTIDEVFGELPEQYPLPSGRNWALAVAEGMEVAEVEWGDDADISTHSRE